MHFLVYLLQENRSVRCALHFRHDIPEPKKFLVIFIFKWAAFHLSPKKVCVFSHQYQLVSCTENRICVLKIMNCDDDIGYFVVDDSENWVVIFRYPCKANQDTNQLLNKEDTFLNACPFPR